MYTIFSKDNCPFCVKAKGLLNDLRLPYREVKISTINEAYRKADALQLVIPPKHLTVPMIWAGNTWVGGYTELSHLAKNNKKNRKTVFNINNTGHETGDYPLFLGEELGFIDTINMPYPFLDEAFQEQAAQHWNEFEVDITQDRQDMMNVGRSTVDLMVKTILWQHLADSIASRSLSGVIGEYITNSALTDWFNQTSYFESIHGRTYGHIIKNTFINPQSALQEGYADLQVIKRSEILRTTVDNLANISPNASQEELKEKLYLAVIAMYLLENINFQASFAITFGIAETGIFQGISQLVSLIARDELLHARVGGQVLLAEMKRDPYTFDKLRPKIQELFDAVVTFELEWTDYLFTEGRQVIGLTPKLVKEYVRYMATPASRILGVEFNGVATNPLPFIEGYVDTTKTQVAPQELQITNYLVNSIDKTYDENKLNDELGDIWNEGHLCFD